jgi:hypothetical protein
LIALMGVGVDGATSAHHSSHHLLHLSQESGFARSKGGDFR